jgi:uncharacterized protein (DUF305 family)
LGAATLVLVTAAFAAGPAPERDQRRFEIEFLTMMIDHHFGGVKLAELCESKATHAELKAMCTQVKTAQTAEISKMQGWLQSWYGIQHTPELDRKTQRQIEELSQLSGAEFEKAFMTILIEHHAEALHHGRECLLEAYHPELINMCATMVGAQGDEIAQLRIWLQQWYGVNDIDRRDHGVLFFRSLIMD